MNNTAEGQPAEAGRPLAFCLPLSGTHRLPLVESVGQRYLVLLLRAVKVRLYAKTGRQDREARGEQLVQANVTCGTT